MENKDSENKNVKNRNWKMAVFSGFIVIVISLSLGLGLGFGLNKSQAPTPPKGDYDPLFEPMYLGNQLDENDELIYPPSWYLTNTWMIPYSYALISPYNAGGWEYEERRDEAQYIDDHSVLMTNTWIDDDYSNKFYISGIKDFVWENEIEKNEWQHMSFDTIMMLNDTTIFNIRFEYLSIPSIIAGNEGFSDSLGWTYYFEIDNAYISNYYSMHELFIDSLIMDMSAFFNAQSLDNDIDPSKDYVYFNLYNLYFADQIESIGSEHANAGELEIFEFSFDYSDQQWSLYIENFRYALNPINGTLDYLEIDNLTLNISSDSTNSCNGTYIFSGISRPKNYYNHFFEPDVWLNDSEFEIFQITSPLISVDGDVYNGIGTPWEIGDPIPNKDEGDFNPINYPSQCLYI